LKILKEVLGQKPVNQPQICAFMDLLKKVKQLLKEKG
jgi:hypothetical protein